MGSLMGASFSRVFESMGVRLGRMTVYRDETSAQRRITPVALFALRLWGGDCFDTCQKRDG
ncbi:hypothetical protein FA223_27640 [Pseudomonas aeruginosa]|nr:hypothetical protein [Pseudomonas aeruginosa]HBP5648785.1 hypothetical protein [Pseudomonas aeruginosa]HBP6627063.1 hypothetical protein [Pseudomonas aeruginosa]